MIWLDKMSLRFGVGPRVHIVHLIDFGLGRRLALGKESAARGQVLEREAAFADEDAASAASRCGAAG